jgi:hypothetical protein
MCGGEGIGDFALGGGLRDNRGQKDRALSFIGLQGKGLVRQRSIPGDLIFGSFHQGKEQRLPRP